MWRVRPVFNQLDFFYCLTYCPRISAIELLISGIVYRCGGRELLTYIELFLLSLISAMFFFQWSQPVDMRKVQVALALHDVQNSMGNRWRHTNFVFQKWYDMLNSDVNMKYWTWETRAITVRANGICRYLECCDHLPESIPDITLSKRKWEQEMGKWRVKYREMILNDMLTQHFLDSLHA